MIPDARFEALDRAGHFPHQEQPRVFAERVVKFMRSN
jgi:pimeloyl-ACP methyl ester carboxylesterase